MRAVSRLLFCGITLTSFAFHAVVSAAPLGPGFTYQGELKQSGSPVTGTAHFRFGLWDAASGGTQLGSNQVVSNVLVSGGIFTVQLNEAYEFTGSAFNGDARWLQIEVCADAGCASTTPLSPRQPITGAPYALHALQTRKVMDYTGGITMEAYPGTQTNSPGLLADRFHHSFLFGSFLEGSLSHGFISSGYTSGARKVSIGRASGADMSTAVFQPQLTVVANTGNVGIGNASPEYPLSFGSGTGDKIALTTGASHFGLGLQSNLMQIHTANNLSSIGFGHGSSGSFTENMRIEGSGRVGIGTALPTEKLDVRGNIRMGTTGSEFASAGHENLRMIRGHVNGAGTGGIQHGSGFTVATESNYTRRITFNTPFTSAPSVVATSEDCSGCNVRICEIVSVSSTSVVISEYNRHDGSYSGGPFHFIAIGPR